MKNFLMIAALIVNILLPIRVIRYFIIYDFNLKRLKDKYIKNKKYISYNEKNIHKETLSLEYRIFTIIIDISIFFDK